MEKMEKQVIFMDEAGFKAHLQSIEELKKRLDELRKTKAYAYKNSGDGFHDNFEFEDAEREERGLLYQISQKTQEIERIVIVEKKEEDSIGVNDIVSLTIISGKTSTTRLYKLVSTFQLPTEEDPYMYVSLNSPIGKAIFQKNVGEEVICDINGNKAKIIIEHKVKEENLVKKRTKIND